MDSLHEFSSEFGPDRDPLPEAVDILDGAVKDYYGACGAYSRKPASKLINPINNTIDTQLQAFSGVMQALRNSDVPKEIIDTGINLVVEKSGERSEYLNMVVGEDLITPLAKGVIRVKQDGWNEMDPDELRLSIFADCMTLFNDRLSQDTEKFIQRVGESQASRRIERITELKYYALDIGKIAIGTAAGMLISRAFSRKK